MKIREIARGLQFPEGPVALDDGSVLLVEIARGTLTRVDADGKTSVVAECGGGPNGAAIGPDGAVYVCNNGGCFDWHDRFGLLVPGSPPPEGCLTTWTLVMRVFHSLIPRPQPLVRSDLIVRLRELSMCAPV